MKTDEKARSELRHFIEKTIHCDYQTVLDLLDDIDELVKEREAIEKRLNSAINRVDLIQERLYILQDNLQ